MSATQVHSAGFLADLGRCYLLVERAGIAEEIDARLRQDKRGPRRHSPAASMLTLTVLSHMTYKNARLDALDNTLTKVMAPAAVDWLALRGPTGERITRHDLNYFFRIFSDTHNPSPLRPRKQPDDPERDAQALQQRDAILFDLMNRIACGWIPSDFPGGTEVVFDTTGQESAARPLPKKLRKALLTQGSHDLLLNHERRLPVEEQRALQKRRLHRAWGARWGHATKTYNQPKPMIGGFHLHTATTSAAPGTPSRPPALMVGLAITPASGYRPRDLLLRLLERIDVRWGTELLVVADRDYSKDLKLWQELRDRNRHYAFDLRKNQLPPRGTHAGALLLQGIPFCPATPRQLRDPGVRPLKVYKGRLNPNYAAWHTVIAERKPYRAVLRAHRPKGITISCPHGRYVQCPLRTSSVDPRGRLPIVANPPEQATAPDICTKRTVFIPDSANPLRQRHSWAHDDWEARYSRGRAAIESDHGQLKSADQLGLSRWVTRSSRIDIVGLFAAQLVALYNLKKIRAWIRANPSHPVAARLTEDLLFAPDPVVAAWVEGQLARPGNTEEAA
jgi:hypothetical protein